MAPDSATGPRTSAGKKVRAPTRRMTPSQKTPNFTVSVRNVPTVVGTVCFAAIEPATAIIKMIGGYRPSRITKPIAKLYHGVLPLSPAKADPLFAAAVVKL